MRISDLNTAGAEYSFKLTGNWKTRVFLTMFEDGVEVGEVSIDPDTKSKTAYINRIDITVGKSGGKGSKLLSEALRILTARGFLSATAYVNHDNTISRGLFQKFGFEFMHSDEWDAQYGDYWRKDL